MQTATTTIKEMERLFGETVPFRTERCGPYEVQHAEMQALSSASTTASQSIGAVSTATQSRGDQDKKRLKGDTVPIRNEWCGLKGDTIPLRKYKIAPETDRDKMPSKNTKVNVGGGSYGATQFQQECVKLEKIC